MQRKTEKLALVVTVAEKSIARRLAEREGESMAAAIRRLIRAAGRALERAERQQGAGDDA